MDTDHFDALAMRITDHLTRRRTLGLAGLLAAAGLGLGLADEADAKKKKRRKKPRRPKKPVTPTCTGCTACQTCVNGACQASPENSACGTGGICVNGACERSCDPFADTCPTGASCYERFGRSDGLCVPDSFSICSGKVCPDDSACVQGQGCMAFTCADIPPTISHCAPVLAA
ncbi:MAG: hypothetical protein QM692_12395 [Thermomicrobiales bacterium]